jgi:tetratricopeptide (TPR) repeat protein
MDKKSAVISRIKNRIFSFIYKLQNRNTEPDITEEKEQTVDSEPISRSENKTETHSPDKKQLIDLKKELRESIDAILNKLFDGISGLLEEEYKDRLMGLERRIEELKKKGEEELVSHLKAYKGELDEVRNLAKTAKLSSEVNIEKIEKIRDMKLSDISDDKLNGILKDLDYIKQAPEGDIGRIRSLRESEIEELKDKIEKIEEMKLNDISNDELKGITTVLDYLKQVPEKDIKTIDESKKLKEEMRKIKEEGLTGIPIPPEELERFRLLLDVLDSLEKRMNRMNIRLFYKEGVMLLKKGAFRNAYVYFNEITEMNTDLKGAWLNRGFALGKLGGIEEEIRSYEKALSIDEKYEKALHNMKIAGRKNRKSQR